MEGQNERTERLIGAEGMERLRRARVAVFGIGGVGGHAAEALARCGVGSLLLVDGDTVAPSNLNRQIVATRETLGRGKAEAMRERILSINPDARVEARRCFFLPERREEFDFASFSYVVDAVDTVTAKIGIVLAAQEARVPVISSMGAGNKLDPTAFRVADIYETSVCPLARVMRRELRKRGVGSLKVVYSTEKPRKPIEREIGLTEDGPTGSAERETSLTGKGTTGSAERETSLAGRGTIGSARREIGLEEETAGSFGREIGLAEGSERVVGKETGLAGARRAAPAPGSVSFVPSVAGLILAGEVVRDLAEIDI